MSPAAFAGDEARALELDRRDPLAGYRSRFHLPAENGRELIYLAGHSLGLMPKVARREVERELERWATRAVEGHFEEAEPWYAYLEPLVAPMAELVGARPSEVTLMNALTVNLHLMLASFYRPTAERFKILTEDHVFPSDRFAVESHLRHHGHDLAPALVELQPRPGEEILRTDDVESAIDRLGDSLALVLLGNVNYLTGQAFDLERVTAAAHRHGAVAGFDLAHSVGNLPHRLHDWRVDFAVWCTYKYLNGGPGAVGGCFVHERHGSDLELPRWAGWWGTDPATRFDMDVARSFRAQPGAAGWQVSNPPILALAPLKASLAIFREAGIEALRRKSIRLTGFLEELIDRLPAERVRLLTPRRPEQRGCALSLRVAPDPPGLLARLRAAGVVCDLRPPDVLRVAPAPLYNTFHEAWRFAEILAGALEA